MNTALYIGGAIVALWLVGGFFRNKREKNKVVRVVEGKCTGCMRCLTNMRKCKYNVLDLVNDENGKRIVVKYPNKCTACGDCVSICKFNALEVAVRKSETI
jgi:NAD-dependent dihydropyrimidine dehydrogenase PreA subunit